LKDLHAAVSISRSWPRMLGLLEREIHGEDEEFRVFKLATGNELICC